MFSTGALVSALLLDVEGLGMNEGREADFVAPHNALVSINGNTSAGMVAMRQFHAGAAQSH
jgi:hypothetical protein